MFENYIPEVAKMLGVGIGEKFFLIDSNGDEVSANPYKFTEMHLKNAFEEEAPFILSRFLKGEYAIKKLPWKPKEGEIYWVVIVDAHGVYVLWNTFSFSNETALYRLTMGNCFQTKEDAEDGKAEVLAKFEEIRNGVLENEI